MNKFLDFINNLMLHICVFFGVIFILNEDLPDRAAFYITFLFSITAYNSLMAEIKKLNNNSKN